MQLPVMPPVKPMLAKPVSEIPTGKLYEPKWDGFRSWSSAMATRWRSAAGTSDR